MLLDRRHLLAGAGASALVPAVAQAGAPSQTNQPGQRPPFDLPDPQTSWTEADWGRIATQYDLPGAIIQLENGNWGAMPRPVRQAYIRNVERVNRDTSYYARRTMAGDLFAVRAALAEHLKAVPEELALTRNATESLRALIARYNRLKTGEGILYSDLDYGSMQALCDDRAQRSGGFVTRIALPEPASRDAVIETYRAALDANPRIRLVLLTHISHRTGLMLPIRALVEMMRARGVDAIVDAAHGLGQANASLADLGADFVGMNLHKWYGAPLGAGAIYVRRDRLDALDYDPAEETPRADRIESRLHLGTFDFAAHLTVSDALAFQSAIGAERREARLRQLRNRWVQALADLPGLDILTPRDGSMSVAITSFRVTGQTEAGQNAALAAQLLDRYGIFTVHRDGIANGACIRVTPALHNSLADMDRLAEVVRQLAAQQMNG